jgi:hypothetical protein
MDSRQALFHSDGSLLLLRYPETARSVVVAPTARNRVAFDRPLHLQNPPEVLQNPPEVPSSGVYRHPSAVRPCTRIQKTGNLCDKDGSNF